MLGEGFSACSTGSAAALASEVVAKAGKAARAARVVLRSMADYHQHALGRGRSPLRHAGSRRPGDVAQLIRRMKKIFIASHLQLFDFVEVSRIHLAAPPEKNIHDADQEASKANSKPPKIS
jgi:hypothetical protein